MADSTPAKPPKQTAGSSPVEILDYAALIKSLAAEHKVGETQLRKIVRSLVSEVRAGLQEGKSVRIAGLGTLRVRDREGDGARAGKRVILSPAKTLLGP